MSHHDRRKTKLIVLQYMYRVTMVVRYLHSIRAVTISILPSE